LVLHATVGYIVTSVAAFVAVAAYLLVRHVPSLRSSLSTGAPAREPSPAAPRQARELAVWLLWLRWVAMLVVAGLVVAVTIGDLYVAPQAVKPLWAGLVALFAINSVLTFIGIRWLATELGLGTQVVLDSALLAWMIHHAGGMTNPFASFFVFNAVIGAIVLSPRRAHPLVLGLSGFVLALTGFEASGLLAPLCTREVSGACVAPDVLHLTAAGLGATTLVYGCARFVLALVNSLAHERQLLGETHDAVQQEREKLSLIVEQMADVVIFADLHGQIRLHNHAALSLWSHGAPSVDELRVCHSQAAWEQLLHRITHPQPKEQHPPLVVGGRSYEPTYAPVRTAGGELAGVVMIARDVTQRLEAEELRVRQERLAVVGRIAASLAHELNNPLSAISLFTQHAIKQGGADNPLYEHLQTVRRNADSCTKIVRDLLTYARQRAPSRTATDVRTVVADAARTLGYQATRAQVDVRVEVESGVDFRAWCDRDQLLQVLVNLGLNGIEAMEGAGRLELRIRANDADEISIDVRDTGSGIPEELQEQIWNAFYTTKREGTGLGLAVAKELVSAHGGRLSVRSEIGLGSTFTVTLPRRASELAGLGALNSEMPSTQELSV
jgi:signal transduction histidine kinase